MNKAIYASTRRSIRDNGMRYTRQHAIDTDDFDTMFMCDDLQVIIRETDWLALRVVFAKLDSKDVAFKLTTN